MLSLIPLIIIHALAVISPGPDLVMIIQQALSHGRKSAILSSLGLGSWILIHSTYCIIGIAGLLQLYPQISTIIQILGAGYLIYLWYSWISQTNTKFQINISDQSEQQWIPVKGVSLHTQSSWSAYRQWLITNLLNPKVTLFILTLYSSTHLSASLQIIMWLIMAINTAAWFMIVGSILTIPKIQQQFIKVIPYITVVLSCIMVWLGWWIIVNLLLGSWV